MVFDPQAVAMFTVNWRRHRPFWMTIGIAEPTGTPVNVKLPSYALFAEMRGWPAAEEAALHWSHVTPAGNGLVRFGSVGLFGM